jgi:hypothetical protein
VVATAGPGATDSVLRLSAEIYPVGAVRRAIEAFSPHAGFSFETRGGYHEVAIVPVAGENERLASEFTNYVLAVAAQGIDAQDAAPSRTT